MPTPCERNRERKERKQEKPSRPLCVSRDDVKRESRSKSRSKSSTSSGDDDPDKEGLIEIHTGEYLKDGRCEFLLFCALSLHFRGASH